MIVGSKGRSRLDCIDSHDGAPESFFVGTQLCGQVGQGRLASELAPELLPGGLELPALTPDAARPCILAERVDHRATNSTLGKRLELDAASLVKAVSCVDEADDSILDKIADVD